jgi:hypothetical protein
MACCGGGGAKGSADEIRANELIDKMLSEEKKRLQSEIKLLLLGRDLYEN